MIGGGTSYDVYFRTKDKPSHPLHGLTYATTIIRDGGKFFGVEDAIDPKSRWSMPCGIEKWDSRKPLEKRASRLAIRIAKRAFPELRGLRALPSLWASWTLPSETKTVRVKISLPE
jgi:hypothetical protein